MEKSTLLIVTIGGLLTIFTILSIRIVNQTERGLIERFGKYRGYAEPGLHFILPIVERMVQVDITEKMVEIGANEIITEDNLNAKVDLVVFLKVKEDEKNVKNSVYKVDEVEAQIVRLGQTTARNVIGTMKFIDVNSKRGKLNSEIARVMSKETTNWGIEIIRVEIKEITPPAEVQATMNQVIQAENAKRSAIDFATAKETEADGLKRATIKEAEGIAQGRKLVADANAYKIKIENEAAKKHFTGNAQKLKQMEVTQNSLQNNSKVILGNDNKQILKLFDIGK